MSAPTEAEREMILAEIELAWANRRIRYVDSKLPDRESDEGVQSRWRCSIVSSQCMVEARSDGRPWDHIDAVWAEMVKSGHRAFSGAGGS